LPVHVQVLQFLDVHVLHEPDEDVLTPPSPALLKLNEEISFLMSLELHWGQLTEIPFEFIISSNSLSQLLQRNSKIGIFHIFIV